MALSAVRLALALRAVFSDTAADLESAASNLVCVGSTSRVGLSCLFGTREAWRLIVYAEDNTFSMCGNLERKSWIKLLPPRDTDLDAFDEELHKGLH